jgi:uncharacterized protein YecE (DUF72 family)
MRVHQNQVNPNAQSDAMYAAQKAAAKREAERTRKKLIDFASELAGQADEEACVVQFRPHDETREDAREQRKDRNPIKEVTDEAETSISDWA